MRPTKKADDRKGKNMTRNEVKELFISWGIEEPTDEQISDYLNKIQKEVKNAEDKANRYKADADKVKDLEKQIEEMNNKNLTETELANKKTEDALKEVDSLRKTVKQMELMKSLAEIGIVGEDADGLMCEDGSLNTAKLGEIITAREKSAVATYQKDALDKTPAPDDKKDDGEDKEDPLTKDIVSRVTASKKAETEAVSIIDSYK